MDRPVNNLLVVGNPAIRHCILAIVLNYATRYIVAVRTSVIPSPRKSLVWICSRPVVRNKVMVAAYSNKGDIGIRKTSMGILIILTRLLTVAVHVTESENKVACRHITRKRIELELQSSRTAHTSNPRNIRLQISHARSVVTALCGMLVGHHHHSEILSFGEMERIGRAVIYKRHFLVIRKAES